MGTVSLHSSSTNNIPHPLDPLADRFPRTLCQIFPHGPSKYVTLGGPEGMLLAKSNSTEGAWPPTFKSGVDASRAHRCHVIDGYHAFELEVPCLRACDYPSIAPVVGSRPACAQGTPKKKSTEGQKKSTINQ